MASAKGVQHLLALAHSEPGLVVTPSELDSKERCDWLLTVKNGTIDLKTGVRRESSRSDHITKYCPIAFNARAACPTWERFLHQVTDGRQELIDFLQRAVGYSLTGSVEDHALLFLYGGGANGKSVFLNTIQSMLGPDYAMKAPTRFLLAKRKDAHPADLADLFGKRCVICSEVDQDASLSEALVKELTGGEPIRARWMKENFWQFEPTHKLWLASNYKPRIRGIDYGIWRRIKLIPFTVTFPPDKQDRHLQEKLLAELPGILNWALEGCRAWQANGLGEPKEVREATEGYRSEMDVIGRFLEECCVVRVGASVQSTPLFSAYQHWCLASGEEVESQTAFGKILNERGFKKRRQSGGRMVRDGIGLRAEAAQVESE